MASGNTSSSTGNTSSSAEMLSSDSKEVVSSMGKEAEVCEMSSTQVAEFATSSSFATRERMSGRVMREPSVPELSYAWPRRVLRMDSNFERRLTIS